MQGRLPEESGVHAGFSLTRREQAGSEEMMAFRGKRSCLGNFQEAGREERAIRENHSRIAGLWLTYPVPAQALPSQHEAY